MAGYTPEQIEAACEMYRQGASLLRVQSVTGVGRETIRRRLKAGGEVRHRLARHAPFEDRLWSRIDKTQPGGCWVWTGSTNNMGYGLIGRDGKRLLAHRAVCDVVGRPIPQGMDACHTCDNPGCVNPNHIFAGTRADNMRDAARKGRTLAGEKSPQARLSANTVREIRRLYAAGVRQYQIADQTGVDRRLVHTIVHRRSWASLP